VRQLSPVDLQRRLGQDPAPLLLDVREPWEFAIARIDGSVNMPMSGLGAIWRDALDPARETVVICHHGGRSFQVALFLERAGFAQVANLDGGINAWAEEVDPAMPRY